MGAPELPSDTGNNQLHSPDIFFDQLSMASDDSDNESIVDYAGYQLLAIEEITDDQQLDENHTLEESGCEPSNQHPLEIVENLPIVETIDAEIEREVWSAPRPEELQIELDNLRTEQIINAMSNITLPNVVVPEWARGVSEERWKNELLRRIRQLKEA